MGLAFVMIHSALNTSMPFTLSELGLAKALVIEAFFGLVLAFAMQVGFAAYHFAGSWLGMQMGLNSAPLFNPATQTQDTPLSDLLLIVAVWAFLFMDGHLLLVRSLAYSFQIVPINVSDVATHLQMDQIIKQFGGIFTYGMMIIAPVVVGLLLLETVIALISRSMPQVNIYFVVLPVKIIVGLLLLMLTLANSSTLFQNHMLNMFSSSSQGIV